MVLRDTTTMFARAVGELAHLWALKDLWTPEQINKKAGINLTQFEEHILNMQDMVTKKVIKKCPEFEGDVDLYLSTIAG